MHLPQIPIPSIQYPEIHLDDHMSSRALIAVHRQLVPVQGVMFLSIIVLKKIRRAIEPIVHVVEIGLWLVKVKGMNRV